MLTKDQLTEARMNGTGCGQIVPAGQRATTVEEVVRLLAGESEMVHPGIRRGAKMLLEKMAADEWRITGGKYQGGFGGKLRSADQQEHITISVAGRGYRLQLMLGHFLRRVTGDDGVELVPP